MPGIPKCETNQEIECVKGIYSSLKQENDTDAQCPKACKYLDYHGEETWTTKLSPYNYDIEDFNATHAFSYQFDPPESVSVYEEYIICDEITLIGSVGGTLGLCIGFSFSKVVSVIINFIRNLA